MRVEIALRNNFVEVNLSGSPKHQDHNLVVLSTQAEIMKFGYMFSQEALQQLFQASTEDVVSLHKKLLTKLKSWFPYSYAPFYRNFPAQVMELSNSELFFNALLHYASLGEWKPDYQLEQRGIAFEHSKFMILNPISGDEWLREIGNNLAAFSKPLDQQSMNDLLWIVGNVSGIDLSTVTVKQTLCELAAAGYSVPLRSVTDVLRVATRLSGGDISLPTLPKKTDRFLSIQRDNSKFIKFKRAQRRYLLKLLESLPVVDPAEMQTYLGRWIRLSEILHPGEYAKEFPKTFAAFEAIRNQKKAKVRTFSGLVNLAFMKSTEEGFKILKSRPGEFARRLDCLIRHHGEVAIDEFALVCDKVSTKVIFEMFDHFNARLEKIPRSVMLKNGKQKVLAPLEPMKPELVDKVHEMVKSSIERRISKLPALGKVFVDPKLKKVPVPFSMQSSSEGMTTLVRGTRVEIPNHVKTLRAFAHWYDKAGEFDLDLGAGLFDSELNDLGHISFWSILLHGAEIPSYNRREPIESVIGCHSGDVRYVVGSNAEYIDLNLDEAMKAGVKYVLFSVYNYDSGSIASIPETTFGLMEREHPNSNEIFDPRTVTTAVKMTQKSNSALTVLLDLDKREWIWVDIERNIGGIPTMASGGSLKSTIKAIMSGDQKLSVYDLLCMHAKNRGELVSEEDAELKLTYEDFTSYTNLSKYLAV